MAWTTPSTIAINIGISCEERDRKCSLTPIAMAATKHCLTWDHAYTSDHVAHDVMVNLGRQTFLKASKFPTAIRWTTVRTLLITMAAGLSPPTEWMPSNSHLGDTSTSWYSTLHMEGMSAGPTAVYSRRNSLQHHNITAMATSQELVTDDMYWSLW